jgi:hypothetical protein
VSVPDAGYASSGQRENETITKSNPSSDGPNRTITHHIAYSNAQARRALQSALPPLKKEKEEEEEEEERKRRRMSLASNPPSSGGPSSVSAQRTQTLKRSVQQAFDGTPLPILVHF